MTETPIDSNYRCIDSGVSSGCSEYPEFNFDDFFNELDLPHAILNSDLESEEPFFDLLSPSQQSLY
jgi:hypothetical protein